MKIGELKVGEEYAVRRGGYGSFWRLRMLSVEKVEVMVSGPGDWRRYPTEQRLARMAIVGDPDEAGYSAGPGIPKPPVKAELFVPGRDVQMTWAAYAEGERARERYRAEQAAEEARVVARAEDFEARITALLGQHVEVKTRRGSRVTVDAEALGRLIEFGEEHRP